MNNQIYDYNYLLEVTDNLHNNEFIESHDIDWNKLHIKTIDSITEKLINQDEDIKRSFFLAHFFTRIFTDLNCYVLSKTGKMQYDNELREKLRVIYETEQSKPIDERANFYGEQLWSELLINDAVFKYVCKCDVLLLNVIMDVSELCMKYKYDVDFNLIISLALMPYSSEGMGKMRYIWNRPDGTCNQEFGGVTFCPKTEVEKYRLMHKDELDALNGEPRVKAAKKPKEEITTFEEAVISKEHLEKMYSFLANHIDPIDGKGLFTVGASRLINTNYDFEVEDGRTTKLYGCLKRFKKAGYFKKMTGTKLHPLVNEKFKTDVDIQSWDKAIIHKGQIE